MCPQLLALETIKDKENIIPRCPQTTSFLTYSLMQEKFLLHAPTAFSSAVGASIPPGVQKGLWSAAQFPKPRGKTVLINCFISLHNSITRRQTAFQVVTGRSFWRRKESKCHSTLQGRQEGGSKELQVGQSHLDPWEGNGATNYEKHFQRVFDMDIKRWNHVWQTHHPSTMRWLAW